MSGKAKLHIHRRGNFIAMLRSFTVLVDDQSVGKISNAEQKEFEIDAGRHEVQIRGAMWSKTNRVNVEVADEETTNMNCGANALFLLPSVLLFLAVTCIPSSRSISMFIAFSLVALIQLLTTFLPGTVYYLKPTRK
jgi:hypothetical protein